MGADLSPIQRQVLLTLRKRGPLTLDALVAAVLGFGKEWSRDEITDALAELRAKALRDRAGSRGGFDGSMTKARAELPKVNRR